MTDVLVAEPPSLRPEVPRRPAVVALLLALVIVVVAVVLVQHDRHRPGAIRVSELGLSVSRELTTTSRAPAVLARLGVPADFPPPFGGPRDPVVVGRLSYAIPAGHSDENVILLITGPGGHTSTYAYGTGATEGASRGWGSVFTSLPKRFPWLAGTADMQVAGGGYTNDNEALFLPPAGPLTFVAALPADARGIDEVVFTVLLVRDGEQVLWAERISPSGTL